MTAMPLYLVAEIADELVALPAEAIGSVVELGTIVPVPRTAPHIAGLCSLRSRVLTVIDTQAALGLPGATEPAELAVIVDVGGHGYALAVKRLEDVAEGSAPRPCAAAMAAAWAQVSMGLVEIDGRPLLLIDPAKLVEGASPATELTCC